MMLCAAELLEGPPCDTAATDATTSSLPDNQREVLVLVDPCTEHAAGALILAATHEDTTRVGPIAAETHGKLQGCPGLAEQRVAGPQSPLVLSAHAGRFRRVTARGAQRVVLSPQGACQVRQRTHEHSLDLPALLERAQGRQSQSDEAPRKTKPHGQHLLVAEVKRPIADQTRVERHGGMWALAGGQHAMEGFQGWRERRGECVVAFSIAGDQSNVDAFSLPSAKYIYDTLHHKREGNAAPGSLMLQCGIDSWIFV
mmetsp:Transcript_125372/g.401499  ORF Transcript_125372/g.401499 Transcript_125372/m.401499 type:complete len:256 (-) Transcript_125372:3126-3893(-)